jgi:hypothetical protein
MRSALIIVLASASVAAAQPPQTRTPVPPGVDISANDGDRILIEDDARIEVVRRRQATIRTIFSAKEQVLIVVADYARPGEFPDGIVDWAFNFYQVEGTWPLGARWEALTATYQYQGNASRQNGFAFETPRGRVHLVQGRTEVPASIPAALAVLSYGGSTNGPRRGMSFAEVETIQLSDFARSKASGATVGTTMAPDGRLGTAVIAGEIRSGDAIAPRNRAVTPSMAAPAPNAIPHVDAPKPPAKGQDIPAQDGDRVIVDDDARVQIIRRRQATIRTIFNGEQRLLIVLADYARPGESPDGQVDWAANFYGIEGTWPLESRWEASTTLLHYEGDPRMPMGYALMTSQGQVELWPSRVGAQKPDAIPGILVFHGAMSSGRRELSFAEAEKAQFSEAAKRVNEQAPRVEKPAP